MVLKEIISELETAEKPVAKMLRRRENFHVLAIGFRKGMTLAKHTSHLPARLVVLKGEIIYGNDLSATALALYDEYEIPVNEVHWVEAKKDSLIILIKGE